MHDMHDMHDNICACRNQALLMPDRERLFLPHHHVALHHPFFKTYFKSGTLLYNSPRCFALCSSTAPRMFPYRIVHCSRLLS
jgi:hypothetical protein